METVLFSIGIGSSPFLYCAYRRYNATETMHVQPPNFGSSPLPVLSFPDCTPASNQKYELYLSKKIRTFSGTAVAQMLAQSAKLAVSDN
jgi:hypothetical protein